MAVQKGSLPTTGQIDFPFDEAQASMLSRGLISSFKIRATISFPDAPQKTEKIIEVLVQKTISAEALLSKTQTVLISNVTNTAASMSGLARARAYLLDHIVIKKSWILFGNLEGPNKIPIVILFHTLSNTGTYSFKTKEEILEDVDPKAN